MVTSDHNINFIKKIHSSMKFNQSLKVVDDRIGTPTNVNDFVVRFLHNSSN